MDGFITGDVALISSTINVPKFKTCLSLQSCVESNYLKPTIESMYMYVCILVVYSYRGDI